MIAKASSTFHARGWDASAMIVSRARDDLGPLDHRSTVTTQTHRIKSFYRGITLLTLSSRAEQNDEQNESFCAVEGPCVQPGTPNAQRVHYAVYMMQSASRHAL